MLNNKVTAAASSVSNWTSIAQQIESDTIAESNSDENLFQPQEKAINTRPKHTMIPIAKGICRTGRPRPYILKEHEIEAIIEHLPTFCDATIEMAFSRISIESDGDKCIYGTHYVRKNSDNSNKDSSFFLFKHDAASTVQCTLNSGRVGQAICFFEHQEQWYCLLTKFAFPNQETPKEHTSGMFLISMVPYGYTVILVQQITARLVCIYSNDEPLEKKIEEKVVGLVTQHVHRL